jgi:uncharacterized membrane protein
MSSGAARAIFVCCLLFVILLSATVSAANVTEFQVESTDLQVYRDGLVHVTQALTVNETLPAVTLLLLGSSVDNFIVVDENQTVLDYDMEGIDLTVFTLGATTVHVEYDTHSLTLKHAEEWTFLVDAQYNLTVRLPQDSTIVDLNQVPASIDTNGNAITLSLFPSQWEIIYVFPLTTPAQFQISNLQVTPTSAKLGEDVIVSVQVANIGGQSGSYILPLSVNQTAADSRTVTLDKGASTTIEFKIAEQTSGTYLVEVAGQVSQFTVSEESVNGASSSTFPIEYLVAAVVAVAAIVFVAILLFRRREPNTEKVFKLNPQLNTEEKDVIQFLGENEGTAFESQIRERFPDIPRTSLWRLVKRLEKMDIIKVKKIGLENQVELKK